MEKAEKGEEEGEVTFVPDCCCLNVSFGEVTGERWKNWKDMNGDERRVSSFSITSHCALCVCVCLPSFWLSKPAPLLSIDQCV
jgi:hypothetical protein